MPHEKLEPESGWPQVLQQIAFTPPDHRDLVGFDEAADLLAVDTAAIGEIVSAGVPSVDRKVDMWDIQNIGLYSGSGRTRPELEMAAFVRATGTDSSKWLAPQHWRLILSATCSTSGDCGGSWKLPEVNGCIWDPEPSTGAEQVWRTTARAVGGVSQVGHQKIRNAFADVANTYKFQYTAASLVGDNARTRERRAGTCTSIASVLAAELESIGYKANLRYGLLMGLFTASLHCWVEVDGDAVGGRTGQTVALDPTLAIVTKTFFPPRSHTALIDYFIGSTSNRIVALPAYTAATNRPEDRLTLQHHCHRSSSPALAHVRVAPVAKPRTGASHR